MASETLSALDLIAPRAYSRLVLCFPLANENCQNAIHILKRALDQTAHDIPVLAASVDSSQGGKLRISGVDSVQEVNFKVKDLTSEGSWKIPYSELLESDAPLDDFQNDLLFPVDKTLPESAPVSAVQVNVIEGGLLVAVNIHQSVMDEAGQSVVLNAWASRCRGLQPDQKFEYPPYQLDAGSINRQPLIGVQGRSRTKLPPAYHIFTPLNTSTDHGDISTELFILDLNSIIAHKHDMSEELERQIDGVGWVSTQDAICAVLWHAISIARVSIYSKDANSIHYQSRLGLAVNARSHLQPELPSTYVGNATIYSDTVVDMPSLFDNSIASIGGTALAIRHSVKDMNDTYIRDLVGAINSFPNPTDINPALLHAPGPHLIVRSWLDAGIYDAEWGNAISKTSKIDKVRLLKEARDGLCIILPREAEEEEAEVIISLKKEDMERLKQEPSFSKFAAFPGK